MTVLGPGTLTRTGYTFSHWNTAADDSGTSYNPADTFTMPAANVVLYAQWTLAPTPTPSPTPTPTPTETPTPTPSPTPSPTPTPVTLNISGHINYCTNPSMPAVPGVSLNAIGTTTGSASTDGSGNYTISGLTLGGTYTVTPTKADLTPGCSGCGINTSDVIAIQQHYLLYTSLTGCALAAADVDGNNMVNTVDVLAVQRFYLGSSQNIANVGKYKFTPVNRTYPSLVSDQTGQDYDALVFGDVVTVFTFRPGDSSTAASGQIPANVARSLASECRRRYIGGGLRGKVTTTAINAANKLVGFQGNFTFDERVISFDENDPVQKAGLTKGKWVVSGHVLPGDGPIRTLRISAYSTDLTPLSGAGTLFELNVAKTAIDSEAAALIWAEPPDDFTFIDIDLNMRKPATAGHGSVDSSSERPD